MYNMHLFILLLCAMVTAIATSASICAGAVAESVKPLSSNAKRELKKLCGIAAGCAVLLAFATIIVFFSSF